MFDNWLNRLTKLATLIPMVSMVIGAMIIHNYLNTIGFNGLFPDIILTSAVLALILIYIAIITTCIYIIPFLSLPMIYQEYKLASERKRVRWYVFLLHLLKSKSIMKKRRRAIWCAFGLYVLMFVILIVTFLSGSLLLSVFILFTIPYFVFSLFKRINNRQFVSLLNKEDFSNIMLMLIHHLCFIWSILLFLLVGYAWVAKSWIFYIMAVCFYVINSIILLSSVYKKKIDISPKFYYGLSLSMLFLFCLLFITMEQSTFINHVLISLGYIEDESKSKLYVVNDNVFTLDKEKDNSLLLSVVRNHFLHIKPDVYYGYMAWNVGEIKVFCPHDTNKEYYKCLPVKRDYLQLIPASSNKMAIEITGVYLEKFSCKISKIEPNVSILLQIITKELHENS